LGEAQPGATLDGALATAFDLPHYMTPSGIVVKQSGRTMHPQYSTTWEGMRLVVEEMQKRGLYVYCTHHSDGQTTAQVVRDAEETLGDAQSDSAPHAVALAALRALREDNQT